MWGIQSLRMSSSDYWIRSYDERQRLMSQIYKEKDADMIRREREKTRAKAVIDRSIAAANEKRQRDQREIDRQIEADKIRRERQKALGKTMIDREIAAANEKRQRDRREI